MSKEKKQISVGKAADFPIGKCTIVEIDGREIGIAQLKNGEFRAVRNHCPHKGAPVCKGFISGTMLPGEVGGLVYGRDGEILVCPWHGYEFDLNTGKLVYQESQEKLLMYPVAVKNGEVMVTI
ncbi:MAG: Rieske (2Fe-2S) protein [Burkholderiales bacterium]|nr:Rieske (2Fe-2S) protein [Burkholderiales bacterium]